MDDLVATTRDKVARPWPEEIVYDLKNWRAIVEWRDLPCPLTATGCHLDRTYTGWRNMNV